MCRKIQSTTWIFHAGHRTSVNLWQFYNLFQMQTGCLLMLHRSLHRVSERDPHWLQMTWRSFKEPTEEKCIEHITLQTHLLLPCMTFSHRTEDSSTSHGARAPSYILPFSPQAQQWSCLHHHHPWWQRQWWGVLRQAWPSRTQFSSVSPVASGSPALLIQLSGITSKGDMNKRVVGRVCLWVKSREELLDDCQGSHDVVWHCVI